MKRLLLVLCVVFLANIGFSQDLKIGVRTGLSYYKLVGELEANETQSLASGFHFAITGKYNLSENFGLRTELCYIQKSSLQEYKDNFLTVFYILDDNDQPRKVSEFGGMNYTLKKTFNIFSIPLHAVYKPTKKIEIFGGVEFDFTAGVIGQGTIEFDNSSADNPNPIIYNQTLNFNYSNDQVLVTNTRSGNITINYGDDKVLLPKSLTAFYYHDTDEGKAFSTFDMALSAGTSYFINPGLYVRATGTYGLFDSTKSAFDHSLQEVNINGSYIFRDDNDHKIGFQISVGFQF